MRIDIVNQVSQTYNLNSVSKISKIKKVSQHDNLQISQVGKDYHIAKQAVTNTPDVRTDKVNDIKAGIASGTYNVSAEEIVDKMMNNYFDTFA